MGTSAAVGILAYGYDLGGVEDGWKVREAGEYGQLELDWLPSDEDIARITRKRANFEADHAAAWDDPATLMEKRLLAASGFTETDWEAYGYFARRGAAEDALGVQFEAYGCADTYPVYVLAAKVITVNPGGCDVIDMAALSDPETLAGYDAKLSAALTTLGITPTQDKPAWLLCSYWD
jgi:hypothetical protein